MGLPSFGVEVATSGMPGELETAEGPVLNDLSGAVGGGSRGPGVLGARSHNVEQRETGENSGGSEAGGTGGGSAKSTNIRRRGQEASSSNPMVQEPASRRPLLKKGALWPTKDYESLNYER